MLEPSTLSDVLALMPPGCKWEIGNVNADGIKATVWGWPGCQSGVTALAETPEHAFLKAVLAANERFSKDRLHEPLLRADADGCWSCSNWTRSIGIDGRQLTAGTCASLKKATSWLEGRECTSWQAKLKHSIQPS